MPHRESFDTVIVGAGAAGLAASIELMQAGHAHCLLEASERVGGRIHSATLGSNSVELGAEFIHGKSAAVLSWLRRTQDVATDAPQERWWYERGQLRNGSAIFNRMKRGLHSLRRPRVDLPFADFLDSHAGRLSPSVRTFSRSLVEGFDAADARRVSTFDVLKEWAGETAADAPTFRPSRGYGAMIAAMSALLSPDKVAVRLGSVVHTIEWRRHHVRILATRRGEPLQIDAARAVITLPFGVLQLAPSERDSVRFDPLLKTKASALRGLGSGPVIKAVMCFSHPFWEQLENGCYANAAFFTTPQAPFPTLWTSLPRRVPLLVAWSAGPAADRLVDCDRDELVATILQSLRMTFGTRIAFTRMLESVQLHNWAIDPYAHGAYSYLLAKGGNARSRLAQQLADTLYFAGEATDKDEAASVGGALSSGTRAAGQILTRHA